MLRIHFSNRFETLSSRLVEALRSSTEEDLARDPTQEDAPTASMWQEVTVVVPSAGVQRRLTLDIAQGLGICTQVHFTYLAQWIWTLLAQNLSGVAGQSPLDAGPLSWRILAAFEDPTWTAHHPRLAGYLAESDATTRLQLAEQVAQLMEAYATFRPEWGAQWMGGKTVLKASQDPQHDEAWQADLWRRLSAQLGLGAEHPARIFARQLVNHTETGKRPEGLPTHVHVMALPSMPPLHLEVLQALALWMDVEVYALNPCQEYWFDVVDTRRLAWLATHKGQTALRHMEVGHPLLAAWGQQTQAQLSLLVQACGDQVLDDAQFVDPALEATPPTLLAQLQSSILNWVAPEDFNFQWQPGDRSIEVHVCHSLVRELEVLHDRLLDVFSRPHPPALDEVAVVLPDLAAAAPWIDAVFGACPAERYIPYTITGLGRSQVNPYAQLLMQVLDFLPSRWTVSDLFALAQREPVSRHFGWSSEDLERIRSWLQDTGTHWGLNADHRHQLGLPSDARHTIDSGLESLFLQLALPQDSTAGLTELGPWPLGHMPTSEATTLGAWWSFVNALSQSRDSLCRHRPAQEWPGALRETLSRLADGAHRDLESWAEVQQALDGLDRELKAAGGTAEGLISHSGAHSEAHSGANSEWPLEVISHRLRQWLDEPARGGVPQGTVTFTSMSSLRNLPFKVVCILHLNDGVFPTGAPVAEFDLLARAPQPGDRQRRLDERNLFLDALLATRETLHLSYTGRHVRDNTELPASVLVSELTELLETALAPTGESRARAAVRSRLLVEHPLQAFSESAFSPQTGDPRLQSFRSDYAQALQAREGLRGQQHNAPVPADPEQRRMDDPAIEDSTGTDDAETAALSFGESAKFFIQPLPDVPAQWRQLHVHQLSAFFRHPARFYLEQRLGLQLPRRHVDLQDEEPLTSQRRLPTRWAQLLLEAYSPAQLLNMADTALVERVMAEPMTPSGPLGTAAFLQELPALRAFVRSMADFTAQPCLTTHDVTWSTEVDGHPWALQSHWDDLRQSGWTRWRYDDFGVIDKLEAWWHHLMLCASPPPGMDLHTRWIGREGGFVLQPCATPHIHLQFALEVMAQGLREPLPFFPKSAWAYVQAGHQRGAAQKEWQASPHHRFAESQDVACQWAWRGHGDPLPTHWTAFDRLARGLLGPLLEHLTPL
ncbi:MAG: exonuclease V subunit gamma [Betaproteobacteria bacterium]|nr:exonuclease V subunit gamma [Betaproteobacteria bacterium]